MNKRGWTLVLAPLVIAVAIVLGMFINTYFQPKQMPVNWDNILSNSNEDAVGKMDMILNMINYSYVDSVDVQKIEDDAIANMLKNLDPHTVYIPAKDVERVNEDMKGNFGGVGIQFYKYKDTVTVVKVVPNGPSEAAGILDGDRIVWVDDSLVAGVKMQDKDVMSLMRGQVGTNVKLTVMRRGELKPIEKKLVRGVIPIKSVDVAYMVTDTVGYIRVNTFGMNTYDEFMFGINKLKAEGMKKLIVDLRDNGGGILPIALKMVNEFLGSNKLMLYTQGKSSPRADYYSNGRGRFTDLPIVVLINESSASASEIFAGAIQDNDRGTIIGRRSFGKGLVQEQRELPDGSALRLTVARYYIPSGRSIQRPYDEDKEKYYSDIYLRAIHGELTQKDSIHFDESLKFQTIGGRTVYGGGGIMPDVFIPVDTSGYSEYLGQLRRTKALYEYTFYFMDKHRSETKDLKDYKEIQKYLNRFDLVSEMVAYADKNGVKRDAKGLRTSYQIIKEDLEATIARHILDDEGFYPILLQHDVTLLEALKNQ